MRSSANVTLRKLSRNDSNAPGKGQVKYPLHLEAGSICYCQQKYKPWISLDLSMTATYVFVYRGTSGYRCHTVTLSQ